MVGDHTEEIEPRTMEEVVAYVRSPDFVWLDLDLQSAPVEQVVELLENRLDFHPLVVEECVTPDVYQPKVEEESGYKFFIFHYFREGRKDYFKASEINVYLGENFVMTLHRSPIPTYLVQFQQDLPEDLFLFQDKPIIFLYHLLDVLIDDYIRKLGLIQNRGDEIEFGMLSPPDLALPADRESRPRIRGRKRKDQLALMHEIIAQRHNLTLMRKSLMSELAILREQVEAYEEPPEPLPIPEGEREEIVVYLGGLENHLEQALQVLEHEREILNQILELHSLVLNARANEIMRVLTVFAAIFIPLTFIVGVYGMNFRPEAGPLSMPELNWPYAYVTLWGIMLALGGMMLGWFWKLGWLGGERPRR